MKFTLLGLALALACIGSARADIPPRPDYSIPPAKAEALTANPDDVAAALHIPSQDWTTPHFERLFRRRGATGVTIASRWTAGGRTLSSQSVSCDTIPYAVGSFNEEEIPSGDLTRGGVDWSSQVLVGQQRRILYGSHNLEMQIRVGTRVLKLDLRGVEVKSPQQAEVLAKRWMKRSLAADPSAR